MLSMIMMTNYKKGLGQEERENLVMTHHFVGTWHTAYLQYLLFHFPKMYHKFWMLLPGYYKK